MDMNIKLMKILNRENLTQRPLGMSEIQP